MASKAPFEDTLSVATHMPVESVEYDTFEYKHFDEKPLSLPEAMERARALRAAEGNKFYRIIPMDESMVSFRVEPVLQSKVYAEILSRWRSLLNRFTDRSIGK